MHRVYTNQFLVRAKPGENQDLAKEVVEDIGRWIEDGLRRNLGDPTVKTEIGKPFSHPRGFRVEWTPQIGKKGSVVTVQYIHPHQSDDNQVWETVIRVSQYDERLEFQIDMASGFKHRLIKPGVLRPDRPNVVLDIVRRHDCFVSESKLLPQSVTLHATDIEAFLAEKLEDEGRPIPIILISIDNESGQYLIDPEYLAEQLVGLAHVVKFGDIQASFTFSHAVGRLLSCFNGGVRTYWPGFRREDPPLRHPLYLGRTLKEAKEQGKTEEKWLRDGIFRIACATAQEGEVFRLARENYQIEARAAIKQMSTIPELQKALDLALTERQMWEEKAKELAEQNENILRAWRESGAGDDEEARPVAEFDPREGLKHWQTAADVLRGVAGLYERLNVWPSALKKSEGFRSPHLADLLLCLRFLNDLGSDYFSEAGLGRSIDQYATRKSMEYGQKIPKLSLHESQTTMTPKWKEKRTFTYQGRKQVFEKHFTMGVGSQEGCIHLYFEFDDEKRVVDIGYCGPHLDYPGAD